MRVKDSKRNATQKIIDVLDCIAHGGNNKKVKDISEMLNMDRATVYRIVEQLEAENMLKVDSDTKRIKIGMKAFSIGMSFVNNGYAGEQIKYILAKTSEKMKMGIGCAVTDDEHLKKGIVYSLYEVTPQTENTFYNEEGRMYPVNDGVYGRVLLAFYQPEEDIEGIVRSLELKSHSYLSTVDVDVLLEEYREIREQGYAIAKVQDKYIGVGVPLKNGNGRVIGCVGATVMVENKQEEADAIQILKECAYNISALFPENMTII